MLPKNAILASVTPFLLLLTTQAAFAADAPSVRADKATEKADATADKVASDKAGNTAVVNGDSLTDTTRRNAPAERFGRKNELAISSDAALTISSTTVSGVDGSTTNIELQPAVDYFVIDNLSVGGFFQFNYTSTSAGHASTVGVGPRVGYNFTLSDLISIWPKAGLSIDNTDTTKTVPSTVPGAPAGTTVSTSVSTTSVALNLFVPIMFHPAPHFFAGLGPFLDTDLSGDPRATTWGAKLTLGGWIML